MQSTQIQDHSGYEQKQGPAPLGFIGQLIGGPLAAIGSWLTGQHNQKQQYDGLSALPNTPMLAAAQRPKFKFDKGDESLMLSIVDDLYKDSPAAALALMDFVAQQVGPNSWRAQRHLIAILGWTKPTPAQITASAHHLKEVIESGDLEAVFTAEVSQREIDFLRWYHGDAAVDKKQLLEQLDRLSFGLAARQSFRRQATARVMLADMTLHKRDFSVANQFMASALVLLSRVYQNDELLKLARDTYPEVLDITEPGQEVAGKPHAHQGT